MNKRQRRRQREKRWRRRSRPPDETCFVTRYGVIRRISEDDLTHDAPLRTYVRMIP